MLILRGSTIENQRASSLIWFFFYELNHIYFVGFLREKKNVGIFKMLLLMLILK